jgi:hypothetical protein
MGKEDEHLRQEDERNDERNGILARCMFMHCCNYCFQHLDQVNNALKANQTAWKEKVEETQKKLEDDSKDKRIQELEEQIRDLMFYIETRQKVETDSELAGGDMVVVAPDPNTSSAAARLVKKKNRLKKKT